MKRFRILVLLAFVFAISSAFVSSKKPAGLTTYGYFLNMNYYPEIVFCDYGTIDYGFVCSTLSYGQVCTVNGMTAYDTYLACDQPQTYPVLYREY
ncbi:hypothetical protein [Pedobacter heparinus]|uniref:hypothetical protein n=1 Tax=Pedobacter heparinus TaxID=984 RepID=UPI00292F7DB2|nr:hypothetical protein [Pedobacter heparinus]